MTDNSINVEPLPWTGERYLPDVHGNIELEHLHRYIFASGMTAGKRVLDIASGEGYGSAFLARSAASVVGVDIAADAVEHARQRYQTDNLEFRVGSCAAIPLPDHCVDVVVSFETIEHHYEHEAMMREIKRVLVPGGLLVISSPDKYEYTERPGGHSNPYHVKELYREEFVSLLKAYFENHQIAGQRVVYGSAIFDEEGGGKIKSFDLNDQMLLANPGIARALYLVAVASDSDLPVLESGILEQPVNESDDVRDGIRQIRDLYKTVGERDARIVQLDHIATEKDEQIVALNRELADRDRRIAWLDQEMTERTRQLRAAQEQTLQFQEQARRILISRDMETEQLRQQLRQILQSRSWRMTAPLRTLAKLIRVLAQSPRMSSLKALAGSSPLGARLSVNSTVRQVQDSNLFDAEYYLASNQDVRDAGVDPARHYLLYGWRENRDPSETFSTAQYLLQNPDVAMAQVNPLVHYLRFGRQEGRALGLQNNLLTLPVQSDANHSAMERGSDTVAGCSTIDNHQDLLKAECSEAIQSETPVSDAAIDAEVEAIRESGFFDERFYLAMYTDLQIELDDAIRHYCQYGWRQGRNPSNDFDTKFYLATYSDIRNAGINPFWHYIVAGSAESRQPLPEASVRYEDDVWFGDVQSDIKLLAFYSVPDWDRVRQGRPGFKGHPQPLLPHDSLGFYEVPDVQKLQSQALIAKQHGLHGFCIDFKADEEGAAAFQVVDLFLKQDQINFKFCLHTEVDTESMSEFRIASIARSMSDRRYVRLKGRPVMLVTLTPQRQAASVLAELKRRLAEHVVGELFIIGRFSADVDDAGVTLTELCDAVLDLPGSPVPGETGNFLPLDRNGIDVVPYEVVASQGIVRARATQRSSHPLFHGVSLGRDDTAGKSEGGLVYTRFQLSDYRRWLDAAIDGARAAHPEDRRFVFINGWNNWNEGLFLEPDRRGGFGRLNETTRALQNLTQGLHMPKVSVIVPNYNHERFLRRRLNSIYGQTYKNMEVILLDDCSSDNSRLILDEYAEANPEITRVLYNETNSGSAFRQWAKGIKEASGDLIWIAESDDYCDPNFLEVLVRCFDDEAVLLAYSKCVFVAGNETALPNEFNLYVSDLDCAAKWNGSYIETSHNEVMNALGIKNTIPNASGAVFRRPVDMSLLENEEWRSMAVAGDWVFYLHVIRGGKVAYASETRNFFRRYEGSTAQVTYKKEIFYREVGMASRAAAALYDVPVKVLERCRDNFLNFYRKMVAESDEQFMRWYDYQAVLDAQQRRLPNVMVSTMGFFPGGAEILPIRLANEFKRQGLSVILFSAGLAVQDNSIRRMLRNDVPLVVTSDVEQVKEIIQNFGIEVLNSHQWHIQKYPLQVPDVFGQLRGHVASLHGMIEHADAFGVTEEQLRKADQNVTTWVYTAEKNIAPFSRVGLYDSQSPRFVKIPNGMEKPKIVPVSRRDIGLPEQAFALCCVSRGIPDKGWAEAIMVTKRARELSGRDIRLVLVGNGPVYDEYCHVGVPDFVHLVGFSENSVGHYAAAEMGIMLTKFRSESFPLTIVDCLFGGKPYIASDVGEIRNMLTVSDSVAGAVIELEDWEVPIEQVAKIVADFASDEQRYQRAKGLVQEVVKRYQIDNVASQYVRLFESRRDADRLQSSGLQH